MLWPDFTDILTYLGRAWASICLKIPSCNQVWKPLARQCPGTLRFRISGVGSQKLYKLNQLSSNYFAYSSLRTTDLGRTYYFIFLILILAWFLRLVCTLDSVSSRGWRIWDGGGRDEDSVVFQSLQMQSSLNSSTEEFWQCMRQMCFWVLTHVNHAGRVGNTGGPIFPEATEQGN